MDLKEYYLMHNRVGMIYGRKGERNIQWSVKTAAPG